ncbi:MAG: hypothetical protein AB7Q42_12865 [Acidimicrobiia bacterium]
MTAFQPGDRIRVTQLGDDGLPRVRYGWVGGMIGPTGPVVVMLDGELTRDIVDLERVELVTVTSLELVLSGHDLLDEPALRRGLVRMWRAEAEEAGLAFDMMQPYGDGIRDAAGYALGEVVAGGTAYVLHAWAVPNDTNVVRVRARRPGPLS